ncbi:N-acetylglucosamine-6-phosphate deacetylase [Granulosicoccus sp. 3-233]|uniref:N-acetylglucosamine-6-phosphate deacetylase n=1 Tax=Granulosicoccus sp. 3-233 TaxID=3417969 RepID=UPI003D330C98
MVTGIDPHTGSGISVSIDKGVITEVTGCKNPENAWISAGLVDIQVNGFQGIDLNDGELSENKLRQLANTLLQMGVTRFLPTLITASQSRLLQTLQVIGNACDNHPLMAATIPMIHVEGPFISPEDGPRGAHPLEHVRAPSLQEVEQWQEACGNRVGLITLSPHWNDSSAFIQALHRQGTRVALGHTHASHEQLRSAVDAGASLSTHLGNGIAARLPRHPNPLWTQLADDRLKASFIADGYHLPRETLITMLRAKSHGRCLLVSDTAALGGMPAGRYSAAIGGEVELTANGRLSVADTPFLAGAAKPLPDGVAYCASLGNLSLGEALDMASAHPGEYLNQPQSLSVGQIADVIRFNWQPGDPTLKMTKVIKAGQLIIPSDKQKQVRC